MKTEKINLTILLLVSLLLSTYLFSYTYIISLDGAFQYIPIAKDFVSGLYGKAFGHNQQPLYSLFIAFVSRWVSDFETAGKLVSTVFGILMIFPVYFLGKRIFDERFVLLSSFFLVIHPYIRRFSADVLKESTYLFFLATGLWFAWRTIQGQKKYPYLLIPLLSVLAYLVRPDGVEIFIAVFLYILFFKRYKIPWDRWKVLFLLVFSSLLLFLPYLIHLREATGIWTLSRAKTIDWFLGLSGSASAIPMIERLLFTFKELNSEIFSIFHPLYLFLLGIGLWKRRASLFMEGERFLLLCCGLHYVVLFLLVLNITEWDVDGTVKAVHFSGRHVLPLLLFSIYWVGAGFAAISRWVFNKLESNRLLTRWGVKKKSMVFWAILFVLVLTIILPKTLKPQRYERLPEKWAGLWIKNQSGQGRPIMTTLPRVAYYADGRLEYVSFGKEEPDRIEALMAKEEILYCVIRGGEVIGFPREVETIEKHFEKVIHFVQKGMDEVIVYKKSP